MEWLNLLNFVKNKTMKKWTILLAFMAYATSVAAIVEGIVKGMYVNGIIAAAFMFWLGANLHREAKRYE